MERNYESMLILQPDLSAEELDQISDKVVKRIEASGGEVSASKIWAKERNFFFFLKSRGAEKKKYYKGCYWLVSFSLDKEKLSDLKETIRLEERILRSMIISKEAQRAQIARQ